MKLAFCSDRVFSEAFREEKWKTLSPMNNFTPFDALSVYFHIHSYSFCLFFQFSADSSFSFQFFLLFFMDNLEGIFFFSIIQTQNAYSKLTSIKFLIEVSISVGQPYTEFAQTMYMYVASNSEKSWCVFGSYFIEKRTCLLTIEYWEWIDRKTEDVFSMTKLPPKGQEKCNWNCWISLHYAIWNGILWVGQMQHWIMRKNWMHQDY